MIEKMFKSGEVVAVESANNGGTDEEYVLLNEIGPEGFSGTVALTSTIKWFNLHSIALHAIRALRPEEKKVLKEELEILAEERKVAGKTSSEADRGDRRGNPVNPGRYA